MSAFGAGEPDEAIKLGEDEALFWAWWCVQGAVREGEDLDESALFTMVEVRSDLLPSGGANAGLMFHCTFAAPLNLLIPLSKSGISLSCLPTTHHTGLAGDREGGSTAHDPEGSDRGLSV